jgi:hypothetical protein
MMNNLISKEGMFFCSFNSTALFLPHLLFRFLTDGDKMFNAYFSIE